MDTIFNKLGTEVKARLDLMAADLDTEKLERKAFRDQEQADYQTEQAAFVISQAKERIDATNAIAAAVKTEIAAIQATKDLITLANDNGVIDSFAEFSTELTDNVETIEDQIDTDDASHEDEAAAIHDRLGNMTDFTTGYGPELESYSTDNMYN